MGTSCNRKTDFYGDEPQIKTIKKIGKTRINTMSTGSKGFGGNRKHSTISS